MSKKKEVTKDEAVVNENTSEQTPFDIEMRFTMNKLLTCRY